MSTSAAEVVGGPYEIVRTLGQGVFGHQIPVLYLRDRDYCSVVVAVE